MSSAQEHLSLEQLSRLAEQAMDPSESRLAGNDLDAARMHLSTCAACRAQVRMHEELQKRLQELRIASPLPGGPDCRPMEEWHELAAGIMSAERSNAMLEHAAGCDACGALLREAAADLAEPTSSDEKIISDLQTAQPPFQQALAKKLSGHTQNAAASSAIAFPKKATALHRTSPSWRWAYAAAAVLLIAVSVVWFYRFGRRPGVDQLLAQAYSEHRTLELRFAGAPSAPVRLQRGRDGSPLSKPASLLQAELLTKQRLESSPNDPAALAEKGREEILEWDYREAISDLERCIDLEPNSADLLRDLATAYFERAEIENHAADYGTALDYLGKAIAKNPQDRVALFNRAIVSERLFLYENATQDWNEYLRLDPDGPWSAEARQRLNELQQKIKEHKESIQKPTEDPATAAVEISDRVEDDSHSDIASDSLDEEYLDVAVRKWLPLLASDLRERVPVNHSAAGKALLALSHVWQARHGDVWLADFLASADSPGFPEAADDLSRAVVYSVQGDPVRAHQTAETAAQRFALIGNQAGSWRARLEGVYSLQRTLDSRQCVAEAHAATSKLRGSPYAWIRTRMLLEQSACEGAVEEFQRARDSIEQASGMAKEHHFSASSIRADSFAAVNSELTGDAVDAWDENRRGLARFWSGSFPMLRDYVFLAALGYLAEDSTQWYGAVKFWSEGVSIIDETANRSTEGLARYRLATDLLAAGDSQGAAKEFERVELVFAGLPADEAARNYRVASEVSRAAIEVGSGDPLSAGKRLAAVQPDIFRNSQYTSVLEYFVTLAEVQIKTDQHDRAEQSLRAAIAVSESGRLALMSDTEQLAWAEQTGNSYRRLLNMKLDRPGMERECLLIWEAYRLNAIRRTTKNTSDLHLSVFASQVDSYYKNPAPPPEADIAALLPTLTNETFLTYSELPSGVVFWAYDDRGVRFFRIPVGNEDLKNTASHFRRLCADPASDRTQLQTDARRLYRWLIGPADAFLTPQRALWIEPDGAATSIPFEALLSDSGRPLAADFTIGYRAGIPVGVTDPEPKVNRYDRALVVASSSSDGVAGSSATALPDAHVEAQTVVSRFPRHWLLADSPMPDELIVKDLGLATVFHYAGHYSQGEPNHTGNSLALEPFLRAISPGSSGVGSSRNFDHCKLVVLSACSTGFDSRLGLYDPASPVRAFLRAGAGRVVASRWDVDSRVTTMLMDRFYAVLLAAGTPAESLREASNSIRSNSEFSHPYYWAGFSVFARD